MEIWKFPLKLDDSQTLSMPKGAEILCVQVQEQSEGARICLWAMVDPKAEKEDRVFRIYGTGHTITGPEDTRYLGTVQDPPFVWHVFEEPML